MAKQRPARRPRLATSGDPLQVALGELQRSGVTLAEIAKKAGVSTKTLAEIKSGDFGGAQASEARIDPAPSNRKFRGFIASLTRLADVLDLDPIATAVSYGFREGEALSTAIDLARAKAKPESAGPEGYSVESVLGGCRRFGRDDADFDVTAVGSPKGGVGRTLFLVHAGLIQACGCSWAGIPEEFPLLVDFDFNCPGLHSYPLRNAGGWSGDVWHYRTLFEERLSHQGLDAYLIQQPVGLAFLLQAIAETSVFHDCAKILRRATKALAYGPAVEKMEDFLRSQVAEIDSPTCILRHLVTLVDGRGEPKLAFFPAGSSNNRRFTKTTHDLNWENQIATGMGVVLLNALLSSVDSIAKDSLSSAGQRLLRPIRHIWIDQSPGYSIITDLHERISSQQVLVSSLAPQSTEALTAWLDDMLLEAERQRTWVNLTFYRGRNLQAAWPGHCGDAYFFASIDHAERHFSEADHERRSIVDLLKQRGIGDDHISIADFEPELMNNQALRPRNSSYYDCVVRTLVSMDTARGRQATRTLDGLVSDPDPATTTSHVRVGESIKAKRNKILVLGEYCGNPRLMTEKEPAGVLKSFVKWLRDKLPRTTVHAIAASHQDIVNIAAGNPQTLWFEDARYSSHEPYVRHGFSTDQGGMFDDTFRLSDFDIAALPAYACSANATLFTQITAADLERFAISSADCRGTISVEYLNKNVRGWSEWSHCHTDPQSFCGVPLFSHFPLIVANKQAFTLPIFREAFRRHAHKVYSSMLSFADIRNAAIVALSAHLTECSLIMTSEPIPRVYEWLLILGIAGCNPFDDDHLGQQPIAETLSEDRVFESTLDYALLRYLASFNQSPSGDWNEAMTTILRKNAGFMFLWPDAILPQYQNEPEFAYAPVPAEFQLSETWLLTIPRRAGRNGDSDWLWKLLIQLMSYEEQCAFCKHGGIPVHNRTASDPAIWSSNALIRILGLTHCGAQDGQTISIPRGLFDADRIIGLGKVLKEFCRAYTTAVTTKSHKPESAPDWQTALSIARDPRGTPADSLRTDWQKLLHSLNT